MTKEQALQKIEELKKFIEKEDQKPTKEERFWGLILQTDSIKIDKNRYPNSTFGFKGDKILWEYYSKNKYFWLSYPQIWSVFKDEYALDYTEIQEFIKDQVEEHFKCTGITPLHSFF